MALGFLTTSALSIQGLLAVFLFLELPHATETASMKARWQEDVHNIWVVLSRVRGNPARPRRVSSVFWPDYICSYEVAPTVFREV
jgi:hypothetical protein